MEINSSIPEMILAKLSEYPEWMDQAKCLDPDPFWDPMYKPEADEVVEKVCSVCPVKKECLDYVTEIAENSSAYSDRRVILGVFGGRNFYNK